MTSFSLRINDRDIKNLIKNAREKIPIITKQEIAKFSVNVQREARSLAPKTTSELVRSIRRENIKYHTRIWVDKEYAEYTEVGRRAGKMPPVDSLKRWAKIVLGNENLAFAVAKSIAKKGYKGKFWWKKLKRDVDVRHLPFLINSLERSIKYMK
jgi:hypothetical protein